ncbi:MAG: hypothetical protein PHQ54_00090 [Candidatus Omnitrophica bacterium]|nr:hypothetical protein [Candidatus Omnitrophota bacterium]
MARVKEGKGRPTNCKGCNKRMSLKKWYYRDNFYFCSKRCWEKAKDKIKEEIQKLREEKNKAKKEQAEKEAQLKAKTENTEQANVEEKKQE